MHTEVKQVLYLKWGTLKGHHGAVKGSGLRAAIDKYESDDYFISVMVQARHDTEKQREALLEAVDAVFSAGGEVINDYSNEVYKTPEEAKKYLTDYWKERGFEK